MSKIFTVILGTLFLFACSPDNEQRPTSPLVINTANGEVRFNVETAQTLEELQTGLMYRTEMPANNGMIFNIYPVRPTGMWMKNTKIALDMLFVAPNASIIMIKENATPMSEDLIICKEPVRAVIELNAGQVRRYGIKVGDKVNHTILNNMTSLSDVVTPEMPVMAKGPNAVMPKGPNAVIPKGPNTQADAPVMPKGPNAVIPKGPNTQADAPVKLPVPSPL